MDTVTVRKRSMDATLALAMDSSASQKLRAAQTRHLDLLRKHQNLTKNLRVQLGQDISAQQANVKAAYSAIKKSHDPGPGKYTHVVPPSEQDREGLPHKVQEIARITGEIDALQCEMDSAKREERQQHQRQMAQMDSAKREERQQHQQQTAHDIGGVHLDSLAAWFSRYGEPKRQPTSEEKMRSFVMKPRRKPQLGWSNAVALRRGTLIN